MNRSNVLIFCAVAAVLVFSFVLAPCAPLSAETPAETLSYRVGDIGPAGGIIFYVRKLSEAGVSAADLSQEESWTYLEAAPVAAEFWAQWGAYTKKVPSTGTAIGSGKSNTAVLASRLTELGELHTAALLCTSCTYGGFSDWFLPSKDELHLMFTVLKSAHLDSFQDTWYWSSSGYDNTMYTWYERFEDGFQSDYFRFVPYVVRPVRRF